jgi:site-specific recombinase XerC
MAARHRKIDLPEVNGQLGIPRDSWPELDRVAWDQVIDGQPKRISLRETIAMRRQGGEPSRSTGQSGRQGRRARQRGPKRWSADRCKQHAATYGLWLGYLRHVGGLDPQVAPAERITQDRIAGFLELVATDCSVSTTHTYCTRLLGIARRMDSANNWAWLHEIVLGLAPLPPDPAQDLGRIRSPAQLLDLAGRLMEEGEAMAAAPQADTGRMGAVRFRDGLMLAVLVYAIIRRRSLLSLNVDDAIIKTDDGYMLTLQRKDTKARRPELIPLPSCLSPAIERYCDKHRLALLANHDFDALWISVRGTPLGGKAVWGQISKHTEAEFGVHITPHFIRNCVATWHTVEHPEYIMHLPTLLQHKDLRPSPHYALADHLRAGRKWHGALQTEREELTKLQLSGAP